MGDTKIGSGRTLREYLEGAIQEALHGVKSGLHHKGLQEKERQDSQASSTASTADDDTDLFSDAPADKERSPSGDSKPASSKTMDDESEKLKQGEIKTVDIVEKLNTIRSGKSFRDDHVKAAMEEYVESLSKAERVALMAFLKGIAQINTGEVPAASATEPDSNPANVSMKKTDEPVTRHVKPNVIKASPPKKQGGASQEDTSSPTPITPKRK